MTMETQRQVPLIESENTTCPLPTPIDVRRLEETLTNHSDQEFVSKLCNILRYGADVGFTGRRVARFSRNLPTALSQPNIVSENLSREVALGRVAGPFPSPPLPNFQVSGNWAVVGYLSQNLKRRVSTLQSPRRISAFSIYQSTMQSKGF